MDAIQINQSFDLLSLAGRDTNLSRHGGYHVGPCPFCGGTDRFNLKHTEDGYRWYCRKCGDGIYHTALDYVMRREKIDFKTALVRLGGDEKNINRTYTRLEPAPRPLELPDSDWQTSTWRELDEASDRLLLHSEGMVGREYLSRRGLGRGTWYAWQLGLAHLFDPKANCRRPAIVIPWFDLDPLRFVLTAVKYRFIDENPNGLRYMSRRGSVPVLFGLWDALPENHTLVLVEGEINALSIWQCLPAGVTCVSFGGEAAVRARILKVFASQYPRVFVWADDPKRAKDLRSAIGQKVHALRSPDSGGVKWDANKMLQAGNLAPFVSEILGVRCLGMV
jgi:DNA primase